jgi:hypothetical protein
LSDRLAALEACQYALAAQGANRLTIDVIIPPSNWRIVALRVELTNQWLCYQGIGEILQISKMYDLRLPLESRYARLRYMISFYSKALKGYQRLFDQILLSRCVQAQCVLDHVNAISHQLSLGVKVE